MTPEQLKASILQYAIQGKLVEQKPEDGSAEDYLRSVSNKLKTKIRVIDDEEKTIDIPSSWTWACLSEMATEEYVNDGNWVLSNDMVVEGDVKLIQLGCIGDNQYKNKGFKYLTYNHFKELNGRQIYPGYLLINRLIGDKMLSCIIPEIEGTLMTAVDVCWLAPNDECYDLTFIMYALSSGLFQEKVKGLGRGTTRFRISKLNLINIAFPLPPLEEQHRIVAKIEELLPYVDRYAEAYKKLEAFNAKFPEEMKKSILQYAIQGKLVEQRSEEGTAEELYLHIQEEKQKLIKEGKIKKEKPLADITEEDIPFDIPESWKWVRLSEIGELARGKSKHRPRNDKILFEGGGIPFIQTGDVAQTDYQITSWTTEYNEVGLAQSRLWSKGTLCLTIAANIGDVAILNFDACFPDSVVGFNAYAPINSNMFFLYGMMCYKDILDKMSRSTAQKNINLDILSKVPFPLPPLEEQHRIVAEIEKLLPYCDRLINQLV